MYLRWVDEQLERRTRGLGHVMPKAGDIMRWLPSAWPDSAPNHNWLNGMRRDVVQHIEESLVTWKSLRLARQSVPQQLRCATRIGPGEELRVGHELFDMMFQERNVGGQRTALTAQTKHERFNTNFVQMLLDAHDESIRAKVLEWALLLEAPQKAAFEDCGGSGDIDCRWQSALAEDFGELSVAIKDIVPFQLGTNSNAHLLEVRCVPGQAAQPCTCSIVLLRLLGCVARQGQQLSHSFTYVTLLLLGSVKCLTS